MGHDSFQRQSADAALSELSDEVLLAALVCTRNEQYFGAIVKRYKRMVLSVCQRVLDQQQDAEDAMQSTWLALWRKARSIRQGESLKSWLCHAAWHKAMNMRLSRRRRTEHKDKYAQSGQSGQSGQSLDELIRQEEQIIVDTELEHLPEKIRICAILHYLKGKSKSEIARELGLKEGTVATRLRTARRILRQRLKHLE